MDQVFEDRFCRELLQLEREACLDGGGIGWTSQHCHGGFFSSEEVLATSVIEVLE